MFDERELFLTQITEVTVAEDLGSCQISGAAWIDVDLQIPTYLNTKM